MAQTVIQKQVRLPISVAFEVVLQGIRIRLGRSIVTMTGVVLGIAFLMSILTGQEIKKGVQGEEELRNSVSRMVNFLAAEVGPARGRSFVIIAQGPLSLAERRLVRQLHARKAEELRLVNPSLAALSTQEAAMVASAELPAASQDAHAILLMGDGPAPDLDWPALLAQARNAVVALSSESQETSELGDLSGGRAVKLVRELRQEEIDRAIAAERRASFRRNWIIIISLLVTVICISNSMLMSVTERFKEIGTMKCLGALSSFIRQMFLIESSLLGMVGSILGALVGALFSFIAYSASYQNPGLVLGSAAYGPIFLWAGGCILVGVFLSVVAALYPAQIASRMVPAHALRTSI